MQSDTTKLPLLTPVAAWKPLRFLTIYRLVLVLLLLLLFLFNPDDRVLGGIYPGLFQSTLMMYVTFSIGASIVSFRLQAWFEAQVIVQVVGDIIFLTLLMHASSGILSGLGTIMVVSIAAGALLLPGRTGYLFAAIAAVAVLLDTGVWAMSREMLSWPNFGHAGILGVVFFTTAAMAQQLAQRTQESEALAAKRKLDLANLTRLNEYVIQHLDTGVLVVDDEGNVRLLNNTARKLLQAPTSSASRSLAQVSMPLQSSFNRWINNTEQPLGSFKPGHNGLELQARFQALGESPQSGALILLEDSSELAHEAQQLKLAALGRLTASIAHEVRNPLGAISHAGQLLAESPHLSDADQRMTEIIRDQCQRVNIVVENILQLSRKETPQYQDIDAHRWLTEFSVELCHLDKIRDDQLNIQVIPNTLTIQFDTGHLHQVLYSLCANAVSHAKPRGEALQLRLHGGITDQGNVFVEVSDNGDQIAAEIEQKLFEPFFTTTAMGTGLGLYIAQQICEHNSATLEYYFDPGKGNTFRILILDR